MALTRGRNVPSSRFRIRQCIPALAAEGIAVTEHCPRLAQHVALPGPLGRVRRRYVLPVVAFQTAANVIDRLWTVPASRSADLIWISRSYVPGLEDLAGLLGRPRVLDVDDAIWLTTPGGERAAAAMAGHMDAILAGNAYLAEWYRHHCPQVAVVPTAVDCARFRPLESRSPELPFTVGWMGTSGNFPQLEPVRTAVARFLDSFDDTRWLLVADRRPDWWPDGDPRYVFAGWSEDREVALMQEMDVGLMPLEDTAWTRGKCSYKMLQAMAAALPVIVSPVGMNRDVLAYGDVGRAAVTPDEWYEALTDYHRDDGLRRRTGELAREVVLEHYDVPVVAAQIAREFRAWGAA